MFGLYAVAVHNIIVCCINDMPVTSNLQAALFHSKTCSVDEDMWHVVGHYPDTRLSVEEGHRNDNDDHIRDIGDMSTGNTPISFILLSLWLKGHQVRQR